MEYPRLLACLDADYTRLRQVAARELTAPVPSCPGWSVDDLVQHVGLVYLHKVSAMRQGKFPRPWPPEVTGPSLDLLDREYAQLTAEFAARKPDEETITWYDPEQTVGFWIRRMAQETVIHRVDAELALGEQVAAIPDDLALDGIDEVLERFLGFGSVDWHEDFAGSLPAAALPPVLVRVGDRGWLVRAAPEGVTVTGDDGTPAAATVSGTPQAVLLWLWRRSDGGVTRDGDPELVDRLRLLLHDATQ